MGEEFLFPLSFQQARLWFLHQLDPGNAAYHMPVTLRLDGDLGVETLRAAFQHVVDRHEALRTRYEPDTQVQAVMETWDVPVDLVDLSGRGPEELERVRREVLREPFDLWTAPPLRVVVVRTGPREHLLLMVIHHIACDGWSLGVLARELSAAYTALREGDVPRLPDLPVQYGDFALWQRDRLSGDGLREELDHWTRVLTGAPAALELATDHPRPGVPTYDGARTGRGLPEPVALGLERLAHDRGASLFMVVLAAYAVVLCRLSGQDAVVVGTVSAGRSRPELEGLVGCFIDVVPLRVDVPADASVAELLSRVRRVCLDAYAHQEVPFERLVEHLQPVRDPSRTPLFQVMLNGQDTPRHDLSWPGVQVTGEAPEPGVSKYDLTLDLHRNADGILLDLEYNRDVFEPGTAARLLEQVAAVLEWMAAARPETPVADAVPALRRAAGHPAAFPGRRV
ncbi:MAG: non-ribosomal peptide synthetase, partial [Nonomuraea sp.]|nr:non-ribosomal peptide synthetase [Nonomuraea sp.]